MSPVVSKFRALVEKLYQRTLDGKLEWNFDSSLPYLWTTIANREIEIEESHNFNGDPLMSILIKSDGEVIERFNDEMITGVEPKIAGFASYYKLMVELENAAKRRALGADKSLDDVLRELDEDTPS